MPCFARSTILIVLSLTLSPFAHASEGLVALCERAGVDGPSISTGTIVWPCESVRALSPEINKSLGLTIRLKPDVQVHCGDFKGLTQLKFLKLAGVIGELPACFFKEVQQLRELIISNSAIEAFPERAFDGFVHLESLRFIRAGLKRLSRSNFGVLRNLKFLEISSNPLIELPEDLFLGLPNLENLWLNNNLMADIPLRLFYPLSRLKSVELMSENLQWIPDRAFINQKRIERLVLTRSPLRQTGKAAFQGIPFGVVVGLPGDFDVDRTGEEWGQR